MPVISAGEYQPPVPHLCGGCGGKIADRYYLLAVDRQWHARCLICCECKAQLDSELTCFARDGNIYCKDDYYSYCIKQPSVFGAYVQAFTYSPKMIWVSLYFNFFEITALSGMEKKLLRAARSSRALKTSFDLSG
ncbi:hypothetical protein TNIN_127111 [Trichonephila inaurata madagascariensis]|uniref:LIM zinc-binding domain-containing protein n=1 Tax=Trichonephila inaurata madagascariensis TaxID=2747483 RepID=A0A8X6YW56_9ARAC|nr:hypothetical protein TNIN_127111 [Trichonephila inaurata madagascariensis]